MLMAFIVVSIIGMAVLVAAAIEHAAGIELVRQMRTFQIPSAQSSSAQIAPASRRTLISSHE
jgi:hypothetical protein